MGRLRDVKWVRSRAHRDKVRFADLSAASEKLAAFVRKLLRKAAKMGIPLECQGASYDVAYIAHSRRRAALDAKEWEIIEHLGNELSTQYGLRVRWGGMLMPTVWMGDGKLPD